MLTLPLALGSLGVEISLRHRSYWEPWRSKLFTPSFVLGALAFRALYAIVRTQSLGVQNFSRHRPYGGGSFGVKAVSVTGPCVGLRAHTTVRSGSRGVQSLSRHCERLGALVFRAFYVTARSGAVVFRAACVTARSWEPWCEELFTLPSAVGSLCAKSFSRHCELLGASVAQAAQSLHSVPTPRDCLRHRALGSLGGKSFLRNCSLLGALVLFSVDGGSWGSSWGPFGASSWGSSWGPLGALLEPFWGPFAPFGVESPLRRRSYWEPWRSKRSTSSFVVEPWRSEPLASLGLLGAGTLASKLCPSLGRLWA